MPSFGRRRNRVRFSLQLCLKNAGFSYNGCCILHLKGGILVDFLKRMTEVIDYIEDNITEEIDFNDVSKIACCGVYQFGRIFSYVVGVSFAEYIRNRRLSLAALELQANGIKVIDTALKFGYQSPDSFTRAFREMHGVSPTEARSKSVTLKMFPRISFQISIKGAVEMDYRIETKDAITCVGRTYRQTKEQVKGGEGFATSWGLYLDTKDESLGKTPNEAIRDDYKLYRAPMWQVGMSHVLDDGNFEMSIGAQADGGNYPGFVFFEIPAGQWAKFIAKEKSLDELYTKIFSEWLPSSGYEHAMQYTVEIYHMDATNKGNDFTFEIWIPVRKM
jgi:AraC family transcriptional regulator